MPLKRLKIPYYGKNPDKCWKNGPKKNIRYLNSVYLKYICTLESIVSSILEKKMQMRRNPSSTHNK